MDHTDGVSDLVPTIPQGSHRRSKNDVGDWKLHIDEQASSVEGATIRAMHSPRPC